MKVSTQFYILLTFYGSMALLLTYLFYDKIDFFGAILIGLALAILLVI